MTIEVLVCRADGTQEIEAREVADTYFAEYPDPIEAPEATDAEVLDILLGVSE